MASELRNLSNISTELPDARGFRIGIIVSEYYPEITESLLEACLETFSKQNVKQENIAIEYAPGTYELPIACQRLNRWKKVDAVIAFGCVVKGDTDHDKYINHSVAQALQNLSIKYGKPFLFGVLTPNTYQEAVDRAGGKHGNKGVEVAVAALKMIALEKKMEQDAE
ncbi:MAG: 6,7-dimethyl-8-ribityllumazine synthase [Chitinophagales bacterium]|jgi:6,7-dimethyl-8-ribityllumazine synthase